MSHRRRRECGCLVALVLALATYAAPLAAADDEDSHIRIADARLEALMAEGMTHSETFRTLVARLESAPVLVFVRCEPQSTNGISAAGLNFLSNANGVRYLRVFLHCALEPRIQLSLLAHEFQHALEVADAPGIVDEASLKSHYQEVGFLSYSDGRRRAFETDAAIAMQRQVTKEIRNISYDRVVDLAEHRTPR